ncbi:MAG TPA: hypothetical protein VKX96_09340 [Chloroflexota bacterium]|nr:hypothetical protein [Chloroflexota bacterium]
MVSPTRPRGLIVVVVVHCLAGFLSLVGGVVPSAFSLTAQTEGLGFLQFLAPILPTVLIVLGLFYLVLAYGLWNGFRWAWVAEVTFILAHVVADIGFVAARTFALDKLIGLAVILAILGYLQIPPVRTYFGTKAVPPSAGV